LGTDSNVANLKLSFGLVPNQLVRRKQSTQRPFPSLGDHIRTLRQQQGLKASELAVKLGIAKSVLLRWETKAIPPACSSATIELVKFLGFMPFPMSTTEEQLYALRLINGWSQEQACQQFKCAPSTWSLLEQGKYTLTAHFKKRLTAFLQKHLVARLKELLPSASPPDIK
jgi:transcriptional regulator with XRE-family HTH domain